MTTFNRVKRNIMEDMSQTHMHSESTWADILVRNSARLTDEGEQKKLWNWMMNPTDEEGQQACSFAKVDGERKIEIPEFQKMKIRATDDEKSEDVQLHNQIYQNGNVCYIRTTPI